MKKDEEKEEARQGAGYGDKMKKAKKKKKRRGKKKLNADGEEIVDVPSKNPFREGVMKGETDWCVLELGMYCVSLISNFKTK